MTATQFGLIIIAPIAFCFIMCLAEVIVHIVRNCNNS